MLFERSKGKMDKDKDKDKAKDMVIKILKQYKWTSKDIYEILKPLAYRDIDVALRKKKANAKGKREKLTNYVESYVLNTYYETEKIPSILQVKNIIKEYFKDIPYTETQRTIKFPKRIEKKIYNAWYRAYRKINKEKRSEKIKELANTMYSIMDNITEEKGRAFPDRNKINILQTQLIEAFREFKSLTPKPVWETWIENIEDFTGLDEDRIREL